MEEIKVLYIIDELSPGGKERRLVELLKMLENSAISSKLVLLSGNIHYSEVVNLSTEIVIMQRMIRKDPLIFLKLYQFCRRWKPDIIHAWGSMPAVYAGPVARLLGIKFINAMITDAPEKLNRKRYIRSKISFPFADVIQSNSFAGLRAYQAPEGKSIVIHNGFDFKRIDNLKDRQEIRRELNIGTRYTAGMVARFNNKKDYPSLIEGARILLNKRNDITFLCVGNGFDYSRIKRLAQDMEKIIFTHKRDDVESLVNIFDIGILSTFTEGISNSIMEYMALGKPVIATDGGGTTELVIDGVTGILIPPQSPSILAEKVEYLLENDSIRKKMGREGRKRVEEKFSLNRMKNEHIRLYQKVISS